MRDRSVAVRLGVVVAGLALAAGSLGPAVGSATPVERSGTSVAQEQPRAGTAPRGSTLRVRVTAPPAKRARVEVSGPKGFRKILKRSATLTRLAPGRYRISAATVSTSRWVARPTISKRTVRVTARRGAQVQVGYLAVSSKVEVVRPATIKAYDPPVDGSGTLTTSADLERGAIVAAGVGAETPLGMLVRVEGVRRNGATSTYDVRQARIDEAIVQGTFETTITADLGLETRRAHADSRRTGTRSDKPKPLCTAGTDGSQVEPTGGIDMKVSGSWGNGSPSLTVSVTPYAQVQAKAWLGVSLTCAKELTFVDRQLGAITVMVGPVPLVFVPRLQVVGGVKLDAKAAMTLDAKARIDANVTATASGSGLSTRAKSPTFTRSASLAMQGNAEIDLYARARLTAEMYGVGGPYAQVQVGVKGTADVAKNPWWQVDAYGRAGVGVAIEKCAQVLLAKWCVSLSAGKDDIIDQSLRIVDAGGPFRTGPPPTTTPTPTPTPTPLPTTPPGATRLTVGPLTLDYSSDWTDVYYGASGPGRDSFATDTTNTVRQSAPRHPYLQVTDMTITSCPADDLAACVVRGVGSDTILGPAPALVVGGRTPDSTARYLERTDPQQESLLWCVSAEMICLAYRGGNGTDPLQPSQALRSLLAAGHWS